MGNGLITVSTPRVLLEACGRLGIDQEEVLNGAGWSKENLQNPSGYVAFDKMYPLWESLLRLTGDQMFGLHAAERVPFGTYRVLDYLLAVSCSLKDALWRISRSYELANSAFRLVPRSYRNLAYLELDSSEKLQGFARSHIEYALVNVFFRLRAAMQRNFEAIEVHFRFGQPSSTTEYSRIFGSRVRFRQAVNRIVLPRELMEIHLPLADPELCEVLEGHAQRQLRNIVNGNPMLTTVQSAVIRNLETGNLTLASLASQFGKSGRSFQREIHANGMTYRQLLDSVRRDRALALLQQQDLAVKEIALRLNFSEASSFCRAFRRWTGEWPTDYRNKSIGTCSHERKAPTMNAK
jgi:AraC-like DNA-binding protein